MPRAGGASSTPRLLDSSRAVSGILGPPVKPGDNEKSVESVRLNPPRLGELDLDPQLDLREHRIKPGIAGRRLQIRRRIAQAVYGGGIEIAREQPDLEIVEHVERTPAPLHRAPAALDRVLLDALQRKQCIDVGGGLRR